MDLFAQTAATGLYDLRGGSFIASELGAYQAALDLLEIPIHALESAVSPDRMTRSQCEQYCRSRGFPVSQEMTHSQEFSVSRAMEDDLLRHYTQVVLRGCAGWTLAEMQAYLRALGAQVTLIEQPDQRRILVSGAALGGICSNAEILQRQLDAMLPLGSESGLSLGSLTWELLDAADLSASTYDAKDFTWEWFDLNGHLLLERGE